MVYLKGDRTSELDAASQKYIQQYPKLRLKDIFNGESVWTALNADEDFGFSDLIKNSIGIIKQGEYLKARA